VSLVLVIPLALASWYGVERRALRHKNAQLPRWLPGVDDRRSSAGRADAPAPADRAAAGGNDTGQDLVGQATSGRRR
jgi:hypothetical protein